MAIAVLVIFMASVLIGLYVSCNGFVCNLIVWTKQAGGADKKSLLKWWICFLLISLMWIGLCILGALQISKIILFAFAAIILPLVSIFTTDFASKQLKNVNETNSIYCIINIFSAIALCAIFLAWVL